MHTRAATELRPLGLSLEQNVVRTRAFGRARGARKRGERDARQDFHRRGRAPPNWASMRWRISNRALTYLFFCTRTTTRCWPASPKRSI